jgi:hypothetical protein
MHFSFPSPTNSLKGSTGLARKPKHVKYIRMVKVKNNRGQRSPSRGPGGKRRENINEYSRIKSLKASN